MLTNLGKEQADVRPLAAIFRARWAVEIQFRAWKQALNLDQALNWKSNEDHMQELVLAGMIAHQLGMRIARRIGSQVGRARLSYEKLYDLLAAWLVKARDLAEVDAFDPDRRHIERDRRIRKSPVESGILALTWREWPGSENEKSVIEAPLQACALHCSAVQGFPDCMETILPLDIVRHRRPDFSGRTDTIPTEHNYFRGMNHQPIELQIAKDQLLRIDPLLQGPHILIGGLAVQKFIVTRDSKDIDLVCSYDTARAIVKVLYPSDEWDVKEVNDDAYRPSFVVRHLFKDYGEIAFGPKVTERTPYKYIDWNHLLTNSIPFNLAGRDLTNIRIPSCSDLAFTKLISFLGRDKTSLTKRTNDLQDLVDLTNQRDFSSRDFLALTSKHEADSYIRENFKLNEPEVNVFRRSSIHRQATLLNSHQIESNGTRQPPKGIELEAAIALKKEVQDYIQNNESAATGLKLAIGVCAFLDGTYGIKVDVICYPPKLPNNVEEFFQSKTGGCCQVTALTDITLLSSLDDMKDPFSTRLEIGSTIKSTTGGSGKIGVFVTNTQGSEVYLLSCSHVLESNASYKSDNSIFLKSGQKSEAFIKVAETVFPHTTEENYEPLCIANILEGVPVDSESMQTYIPTSEYVTDPFDYLGKSVRKLAGSGEIIEGRVEMVQVDNLLIHTGDNSVVMKDMIGVVSRPDQRFSAPGDSGSVVFTEDGRALGIIVASARTGDPGKDRHITFVAPLSGFLQRHDLHLLGYAHHLPEGHLSQSTPEAVPPHSTLWPSVRE